MDKLTKIQVHYEVPAKGMDHCRDCKFFITSGHCKIVEGSIQPNGWCSRFEEKKMHAGHGFTHTHIEHHSDGSHTIEHVHEGGPEHDVKHAAIDHDSMIDSLFDHLDPEQIEDELKKRGIDAEKLEETISPGIHEEMAGLLK